MVERRGRDAREVTDWHHAEPGLGPTMTRELARFERRMRARPRRVLLLAALLSCLAVVAVVARPRLYTARIILRATQGSLNPDDRSILSDMGVRDRIYDAAFTKHNLITNIIEEHGIHRDTFERLGPEAAIEEIMDPLTVEVTRNYFLYSLREESSPRSLRVIIGYQWTDAEFAYRMACLLADLVVENVQSRRLIEARIMATNARDGLARLERKVAMQREQLNALMFALTAAEVTNNPKSAARLRVDIVEVTESLLASEDLLEAMRTAQREREFLLRVEERNLALIWDVAGEVRPRPVRPPGVLRLTALALACFCALVPLCAIALGAFDSKMYDADDVTRLGIPVVGHIPAFFGDHVGSLAQRGAVRRKRLGFGRNRRMRGHEVA